MLAGPEECLVTYTGRLDLEKGIDTLLNAFALLKRQRSDVRLAIVGRGALRETIQEHTRKLHLERDVMLCGYLEGQVLRSLYRVSDIHVCPSHYEPFGLVALEAMAAGTPVVVSDTGGLRDIVTGDRVGRKFPPRDVPALADALQELVDHPGLRRELGQAGRKHVLQNFAWARLVPKAVAFYQQAVEAAKAVNA